MLRTHKYPVVQRLISLCRGFHFVLFSLSLCVGQKNEDEAVVDHGGTRSQQGTNFEQEDLEGTWSD